MKKIYFILTAIFAVLLSSCTNDDIPVNQTTTFKINPSTVVSSYIEKSAGELTVLPSNLKLHVRLLIYNNAGKLIASDSQYYSDYSHIMSSKQNLEEGNYTVITMTNVVSDTDDDFSWILTGESDLTSMTLTESDCVREQWGILGLETTQISITSTTNDININIKPAGALVLVDYLNWNKYSDVVKYELLSNRVDDNITFSINGQPNFSVHSSNDLKYILSYFDWDPNNSGAHAYVFLFPMQSSTMQFACETKDKIYYLAASGNNTIERGKEYYFSIDVEKNEAQWKYFTSVDLKSGIKESSDNYYFSGKIFKSPLRKDIILKK